MKTTLPSDQKAQPYFYTKPALTLSPVIRNTLRGVFFILSKQYLLKPIILRKVLTKF